LINGTQVTSRRVVFQTTAERGVAPLREGRRISFSRGLQNRASRVARHARRSSFGHSLLIRHSGFVIRHCTRA
jgi:hypothetical protein